MTEKATLYLFVHLIPLEKAYIVMSLRIVAWMHWRYG